MNESLGTTVPSTSTNKNTVARTTVKNKNTNTPAVSTVKLNNGTRKNNGYPNKSMLSAIKTQIESQPGSYRFLYNEPKSLDSHYFFVGLNPGGVETDPSDLFVEEDNAYVHEKWDKSGKGYNGLQQQVIYLFQQMADHLGVEEWIPYMSKKWMFSNYVFYRSPRWNEMVKKKDHINVCKDIWKQIFTKNTPKIIIANGHDTYDYMNSLLKDFGYTLESEKLSPRAWDGPHIRIMKKDDKKCLVIGFAHLSTFKLVKRKENKESMEALYKLIKEHQ